MSIQRTTVNVSPTPERTRIYRLTRTLRQVQVGKQSRPRKAALLSAGGIKPDFPKQEALL